MYQLCYHSYDTIDYYTRFKTLFFCIFIPFHFFLFQNADLVNTQNWLNLFAEVILVSVFPGCSVW